MSQITNDGLTRSGTGCFIAVYPYGNSGCQMVNTFHDGPTDLLFLFHLFSLCAAVVSAGPTELWCATLRELRVVLVLGRSVKKIRQDRVWRRTRTRRTLKKLSLPIFECQHTVTLKTWNGNAVKLANSNNRLFMKTDCTHRPALECIRRTSTYHQYRVLVDDKYTKYADTDWLSVKTIQKHDSLHV